MNEPDNSKVLGWIEKEEKIEVTFKAPIRETYDDKLVAFIDILGMSDLQANSVDAEDVLEIMRKIQKYVETECYELGFHRKLNYLQVGDGFLIVTDLDCINQLLVILSKVQWQVFVYSKMLLRGALTAGKVKVSEEEKLFIGPAIIDAFRLERKNAIFPRILYANEIEKYVPKRSVKFEYISEDNDKFKYLDFIDFIYNTERLTRKRLDHLLTSEGIKYELKTNYDKFIIENKAIAQKYGWLISKFKRYNLKIL